jgi:hypothetical protein
VSRLPQTGRKGQQIFCSRGIFLALGSWGIALPKIAVKSAFSAEFVAFCFDSYDCVAEWENGSEERSNEQGKDGHIWNLSAYCPSLAYPYAFKWLF